MFEPRYLITSKVLKNLINFEKSSLVVGMAPLQTEWETKLKTEALIKRENSVLRYSGNQLDIDDITKIVNDDPGRDDKPSQLALRSGVVAKEKDIQKAMNWLNADKLIEQTAYLSKKFKQGVFEEKDLESINSLLGERIVSSVNLGKYRETVSSELPELKCPQVIEIPYQIEDLFIWFKGSYKSEIHPVLKASTMLFEITRIRPFNEDNVLTGLFFAALILSSEGFNFKGIWSPEEELLKNKQKFIDVLRQTIESNDLSGWFEFLTSEFANAAEKAKIKVMNLVGEGPIFKTESGKAISLTERQIAIMEEMTIQNEMTIKEIRSILPMVSDDTILRDMKDLITKKLIKKKGKTKGAVYVLGKVKGFK